MANMKPQNPNLTWEQQREIVGRLMVENGLESAEGIINENVAAKSAVILHALQMLGMGRNENTVNALRFAAALFESEISQEVAAAACAEREKQRAIALAEALLGEELPQN